MDDEMQQALSPTLEALKAGQIILYPTDTVWGLGCDATDSAAIDRIYRLKQRDDHKSMIVLIADKRAVLRYTAGPDPAVFDLMEQADRPTTVILEGALGLPENLIGENGSIAMRLVRDPFCKALVKRLGKPLVSTSANLSGAPTPGTFAEISLPIRQGVDYTVPYRQNDRRPAVPSRIVRLRNDGTLEVIRS